MSPKKSERRQRSSGPVFERSASPIASMQRSAHLIFRSIVSGLSPFITMARLHATIGFAVVSVFM